MINEIDRRDTHLGGVLLRQEEEDAQMMLSQQRRGTAICV